MVPTARLELAQPKSLPPQDSVSTNSTTSAKALNTLNSMTHCALPCITFAADLLRDIACF